MIKEIRDIVLNAIQDITTIEPAIKVIPVPSFQDIPFLSVMVSEIDFKELDSEVNTFKEGKANCEIISILAHNEAIEIIQRSDNIIDYIYNQILNIDRREFLISDGDRRIIINSVNVKNARQLIYEKNQNEIIINVIIEINFLIT